MTTGLTGTFVIGCTQTETDGIKGAAPSALVPGSSWRWQGHAVCIDGPSDRLLLGDAMGEAELSRRAGRRLRRILGDVLPDPVLVDRHSRHSGTSGYFTLTDGVQVFRAAITGQQLDRALLIFAGRTPPKDQDLWVVETNFPETGPDLKPVAQSMVCFAASTLISTPGGRKPVWDLAPGDLVETMDNGPRPVVWAGHTDVDADEAKLCPNLRPVRLRSGAFGPGAPGDSLILSPDHRIVVGGDGARDLFNEPQVMVSAQSLIDGVSVRAVPIFGHVRYHHIMLEDHQVIWANGVGCETFHPGDADLFALEDEQRLALMDVAPDVFRDSDTFGPYARRCLSPAQAEVLLRAA